MTITLNITASFAPHFTPRFKNSITGEVRTSQLQERNETFSRSIWRTPIVAEKIYTAELRLNWIKKQIYWIAREANTCVKYAIIGVVALTVLGLIPILAGWMVLRSIDREIETIKANIFTTNEEAKLDAESTRAFCALWETPADWPIKFYATPLDGSSRLHDEVFSLYKHDTSCPSCQKTPTPCTYTVSGQKIIHKVNGKEVIHHDSTKYLKPPSEWPV